MRHPLPSNWPEIGISLPASRDVEFMNRVYATTLALLSSSMMTGEKMIQGDISELNLSNIIFIKHYPKLPIDVGPHKDSQKQTEKNTDQQHATHV